MAHIFSGRLSWTFSNWGGVRLAFSWAVSGDQPAKQKMTRRQEFYGAYEPDMILIGTCFANPDTRHAYIYIYTYIICHTVYIYIWLYKMQMSKMALRSLSLLDFNHSTPTPKIRDTFSCCLLRQQNQVMKMGANAFDIATWRQKSNCWCEYILW